MNPSSNEAMQLPPPVMEQAPETTGSVPPEKAPTAAERVAAQVPAAAPALPVIPLPIPPTTGQTATTSTGSAAAPPVSAAPPTDDGDLIEKEWVSKAKRIVERNRDDPYKQSDELTVFKADYMKKRYGKNIKVSK
jgi:hypothetical protein